jgi:DNA-binding LacI/PurR family transcriptional regulator
MTIRTLIIDDEPPARRGVVLLLASQPDFSIAGQCQNGKEAVSMIAATKPDLIFLDIQLPGNLGPTSSFEGGLKFSRQMLDSNRSFTAVPAFDDLAALGVVRGLNGAGLRVPEDYSVLGFDDVMPAAVATPGITTIRQPLKEMGLQAAEWVLKEVAAREQKSEPTPQLYKAQPELVVRMSSSRPTPASSRPTVDSRHPRAQKC